MRLMPASAAAAEKLANERRTPGRPSEVVSKRTRSVPKKFASAAAAAPLKLLCPDVYAGNGGVSSSGVQLRSAGAAGLPLSSDSRMAVIGRQNANVNLHHQHRIAVSAMLTFSSANRRAFCASVLPRARAASWAIRFQCPGGVDVPGSSAQNLAISVWSGVRTALA